MVRGVLLAMVLLAGACSTGAASDSSSQGEPPAQSAAQADSAGACGLRGRPDCPLQLWMKANALRAMEAGDTEKLTHAFETVASLAPAEYADWASIARKGGEDARAGDLEGARKACRACHEEYRAPYRNGMRSRPIAR